jgi:hypothetical protein
VLGCFGTFSSSILLAIVISALLALSTLTAFCGVGEGEGEATGDGVEEIGDGGGEVAAGGFGLNVSTVGLVGVSSYCDLTAMASNVLVFAGEVDSSVANEIEGLVVDRGSVTGAEEDNGTLIEEVPLASGISFGGVFATGPGEVAVLPFCLEVPLSMGATVAVGDASAGTAPRSILMGETVAIGATYTGSGATGGKGIACACS